MRRLLATLALFALSACTAPSMLPATASSSDASAQRVGAKIMLPIVWNNQTPYQMFPIVENGGDCWAPASAIKPLAPGESTKASPTALFYVEQRCGLDPSQPFTVTWGTRGTESGCTFSVQYSSTLTGGSPFIVSASNVGLECVVSYYATKAPVLITEVTVQEPLLR